MSLFAKSIRRLGILFYLAVSLAGVGALLVVGLFFIAVRNLPQVPQPLSRIIDTPPTEIFAATGETGSTTVLINCVRSKHCG
jgi:penicillin-binding protein 1A